VSQVAPRRSVSPTQSSSSNLTAVPSQPAAARSHDAKPIRESQEDRAECSVDARSQESRESLSQLESPIRAPSSGEVGEEAGQSPGDAFPPRESSVSDSDESSPAAPEQRSSDEPPAQSATTGLKSNRPVLVPEDVPKRSSETSDSSSVSADKPSGKQSRRAPRSIAEPSQHSTQDAPQRRTISKRKPVASEWPGEFYLLYRNFFYLHCDTNSTVVCRRFRAHSTADRAISRCAQCSFQSLHSTRTGDWKL
jgi:hypothetical protein